MRYQEEEGLDGSLQIGRRQMRKETDVDGGRGEERSGLEQVDGLNSTG